MNNWILCFIPVWLNTVTSLYSMSPGNSDSVMYLYEDLFSFLSATFLRLI